MIILKSPLPRSWSSKGAFLTIMLECIVETYLDWSFCKIALQLYPSSLKIFEDTTGDYLGIQKMQILGEAIGLRFTRQIRSE